MLEGGWIFGDWGSNGSGVGRKGRPVLDDPALPYREGEGLSVSEEVSRVVGVSGHGAGCSDGLERWSERSELPMVAACRNACAQPRIRYVAIPRRMKSAARRPFERAAACVSRPFFDGHWLTRGRDRAFLAGLGLYRSLIRALVDTQEVA